MRSAISYARPYTRPSLGAIGSVATHVVVAALMSFFSRDECLVAEQECIASGEDPATCRAQYDECKGIPKTYDLVEFDLPEPEPEKPPEPEPEPEKPPEPEPEPVVKPEVQPAKLNTPKPERAVKPAPISEKPESDEPPPPFRIDQSQTTQNGNSAVTVNTGTPGGTPGGTGDPNSKGKGSRPKDAPVGDGNAAPWEPRGELYIRDLPQELSVPKEQCAAVQELGIQGVVILTIQIRRDGTIKDVKITKDIGHGCGKVAAKALRRARFKPAIATNGQPADFELRYEYEFQLQE